MNEEITVPEANTLKDAKQAAKLAELAAREAGLPPEQISAAEATAIGTVTARRTVLGA